MTIPFKTGDRVRIEAPDNHWHGETATIAEIWENPLAPLILVKLDNRSLCIYESGLNAISRTFLRLIENEARSCN
ncbi:MAG: hypothetical protein KC438_13590 [Thermomicrobiales bacterium]|nr:hypothetical protein [Thermomicrobiales bacterium]